MLEKILFILVAVHGPIFIIDFLEAKADGFPVGTSVSAALSDGFSKLLLLSLPAALLAAVARNMTQLITGALALLVPCVTLLIMASAWAHHQSPTSGGGLAWIREVVITVIFVWGAAIILPRQYFQRATASSRALIVAGAALAVIIKPFLPWGPGFAIQQWFAQQPGAGASISINFDPHLGRFQQPGGVVSGDSTQGGSTAIHISIPLHVAGVPATSMLVMDRANIRIANAAGDTLYRGITNVFAAGGALISERSRKGAQEASPDNNLHTYFKVAVRAAAFAAAQNQSVRLEIDYSLTLLHWDAVDSIAAINGQLRTANGTLCATRIDSDEIQVACRSAKKLVSCATLHLQDESSGKRNPEVTACSPYYAPYNFGLRPQLAVRQRAAVPFLDSADSTHYPVDGSKLSTSRIVISRYEAQDHFTRRLVIAAIRLSDWQAETKGTAIADASSHAPYPR